VPILDTIYEEPKGDMTHYEHFSIYVTLVNKKNQHLDVSQHIDRIVDWYVLGAKDFKTITNFKILYNIKTGYFDASYISAYPNSNQTMYLADPDIDGTFPLKINGDSYYVIGCVVNT
jgi:hypothetical protein